MSPIVILHWEARRRRMAHGVTLGLVATVLVVVAGVVARFR